MIFIYLSRISTEDNTKKLFVHLPRLSSSRTCADITWLIGVIVSYFSRLTSVLSVPPDFNLAKTRSLSSHSFQPLLKLQSLFDILTCSRCSRRRRRPSAVPDNPRTF